MLSLRRALRTELVSHTIPRGVAAFEMLMWGLSSAKCISCEAKPANATHGTRRRDQQSSSLLRYAL